MRWQGLMPELITSNPACLLKLCLAMMKSFCYLPYYFTFCNYDIGSGKGCPDPAFPLLSRESRIPNLCHRYPEYRFLSKSRIRAQISENPALSFGQIPDPGNTLHVRCQFNSSFFLVDSEKTKELR